MLHVLSELSEPPRILFMSNLLQVDVLFYVNSGPEFLEGVSNVARR